MSTGKDGFFHKLAQQTRFGTRRVLGEGREGFFVKKKGDHQEMKQKPKAKKEKRLISTP